MTKTKNSYLDLARLGFTLIETLVSISILVLLVVVIMNSIASFRESSALDQAVDEALEILREARSKTLGSVEASNYGVHFANDSMTLFKGGGYDANDPKNSLVALPAIVVISAVNISTTTANITFERLSGMAEATGTITFITSGFQKTKQIEILPSGLFRKL